jgi:hypothetical protein
MNYIDDRYKQLSRWYDANCALLIEVSVVLFCNVVDLAQTVNEARAQLARVTGQLDDQSHDARVRCLDAIVDVVRQVGLRSAESLRTYAFSLTQ